MATLLDSYSESNYVSDTSSNVGQSFTGDGNILDSCKFYVEKEGSPTGNVYAKVYAHSGTFGSTGVPSGSALATSDAVDASTFSASKSLATFTFSGSNRITLTNSTKYFVTIENSLSFPDYILVGYDSTSPSHSGNYAYYSGGWNYDSSRDLCFYIYVEVATSPSASPSSSSSASTSPSSSLSPSPSQMDSFFGLKVLKPQYALQGKNVFNTQEPFHYIFNSDYGTLKYFEKQTAQITVDADAGDIAGTATISHSLNYYPYVEVYVNLYRDDVGSDGHYEYVPFMSSGVSVVFDATYKITTTGITLYAGVGGVATGLWVFDFIVFIYKNNLNL